MRSKVVVDDDSGSGGIDKAPMDDGGDEIGIEHSRISALRQRKCDLGTLCGWCVQLGAMGARTKRIWATGVARCSGMCAIESGTKPHCTVMGTLWPGLTSL